jgi:hypothetical protein
MLEKIGGFFTNEYPPRVRNPVHVEYLSRELSLVPIEVHCL